MSRAHRRGRGECGDPGGGAGRVTGRAQRTELWDDGCGRVTMKVEPWPSSLSTRTQPSCLSTNAFTTASPGPGGHPRGMAGDVEGREERLEDVPLARPVVWKISRTRGVIALRAYQPPARRVHQLAALPYRAAPPWVFCFASGRQSNYAAARGGGVDIPRGSRPYTLCCRCAAAGTGPGASARRAFLAFAEAVRRCSATHATGLGAALSRWPAD
jgi:hypothetical protein